MVLTLLEQAYHESVLGGSTAYNRTVDNEQAISIAALYYMSGKVRTLRESKSFFVDFCLCFVPFHYLSSSCHCFNSPGSFRDISRFARLIKMDQRNKLANRSKPVNRPGVNLMNMLLSFYEMHAVGLQHNQFLTRTSVLEPKSE